MRYPNFLKAGTTIGVPAPAFGAVIEPYKSALANAKKTFSAKGFSIAEGKCVNADDGIGISSTPKACAQELENFYCNEEFDALISCGGGELMCETLPNINFNKIKQAKPKWFMGYSDNTNFTFTLATMCDTASIYGPCAPTFGMQPWHASLEDAFDVTTGKTAVKTSKGTCIEVCGYNKFEVESTKSEEEPLAPYNCTQPSVKKTFAGGEFGSKDVSFSGRLIGGCLDILAMLVGTKFDKVSEFNKRYAQDGIIWFFEACDLNPMGIRRALWQMENAGWLENVSGFLVGRPLCGTDAMLGLNATDAVCGILSKYNVPIILDADFGHVPPAMPIICGSLANVSCTAGNVKIEHELA